MLCESRAGSTGVECVAARWPFRSVSMFSLCLVAAASSESWLPGGARGAAATPNEKTDSCESGTGTPMAFANGVIGGSSSSMSSPVAAGPACCLVQIRLGVERGSRRSRSPPRGVPGSRVVLAAEGLGVGGASASCAGDASRHGTSGVALAAALVGVVICSWRGGPSPGKPSVESNSFWVQVGFLASGVRAASCRGDLNSVSFGSRVPIAYPARRPSSADQHRSSTSKPAAKKRRELTIEDQVPQQYCQLMAMSA